MIATRHNNIQQSMGRTVCKSSSRCQFSRPSGKIGI